MTDRPRPPYETDHPLTRAMIETYRDRIDELVDENERLRLERQHFPEAARASIARVLEEADDLDHAAELAGVDLEDRGESDE